MNGHSSIVSKLLRADVDNRTLNVKSQDGTALDRAAHEGHEQIVEELLEAGADHGDAMNIATQKGHEGVVRILIKYGAVYKPADEV
jgi:ankyrin repeat protein